MLYTLLAGLGWGFALAIPAAVLILHLYITKWPIPASIQMKEATWLAIGPGLWFYKSPGGQEERQLRLYIGRYELWNTWCIAAKE